MRISKKKNVPVRASAFSPYLHSVPFELLNATRGFGAVYLVFGDEQPPALKGQLLWTIRGCDDGVTFPVF